MPGIGANVVAITRPDDRNRNEPGLIRIVTDNITDLVGFYQHATGTAAEWATPDFAELVTPSATLAIASTRTLAFIGAEVARAGANHTAIIEFLVDDVDDAYQRIREIAAEVVAEPTTMPWGNRSLLVRDPDGTLVNFFTPVTPEAIAKFRRHSRAA